MDFRWLPAVAVLGAGSVESAFAAQYLTIEEAQRAAFPTATAFRESALSSVFPKAPETWRPRLIEAFAGTTRAGWLVVDQVIGKSELITFSVALATDGEVLDVEVLDYRESHGGEIRLAAWRKQFLHRRPSDAANLPGAIRIISGATLSCRHLTEGVQRILRQFAAPLT